MQPPAPPTQKLAPALYAILGVWAVATIAQSFAFHQLLTGSGDSALLKVAGPVAGILGTLVPGLIAGILLSRRVRGVLNVVALWAALACAIDATLLVGELVGTEIFFRLLRNDITGVALLAVHYGWLVLGLGFLAFGKERRNDVALIGFVLIVANVVMALGYRFFSEGLFAQESYGLFLSIQTAQRLFLLMVPIGLLGRESLKESEGNAPVATWATSRAGLTMYRTALVWRCWLTFFAMMQVVLAGMSRSHGYLKFLVVLMPVIAAVTSAFMAVGLFRYARQPSGTSPMAMAAAVIAVLGTLFELAVLSQVKDAYGPSMTSLSLWGAALGMVGLAALLQSFWRIAVRAGDQPLKDRIGAVAIFFALAVVGAFGLNSLKSMRISSFSEVFAILLVIAAAAIALLFAYVRLVRAVEDTMLARESALSLPSAGVVKS